MSTMKAEAIAGPEAWLGADMTRSTDWIRTLSAPAVAELDAATRGLERRGLAWPSFGNDDFPLPTFSRELSSVLDELERGRGFVLLRGIPVDRYTPDELKNLYWGLGAHLGHPRHVIYHGRTAYEDADGPDRDRLLLRLWLAPPNSRALPPGFEALWGTTAPGAPRGGIARPR